MNPYLSLLIGMLLGSTSGVFIKKLDLTSTSLAFFRLSIPLLITFIYLKYEGVKLFTKGYKTMLLASLFNAIRLFFYFAAFLYTTITNAIIMLYTWPIFAAIFGSIFLKEKISRRQIMLFALAFSGIIIMSIGKDVSFTDKDFLGIGAALISAIVLALTNISYKKVIDQFSNTETIFYQNFIGSFLFLPFIFINKPFPTTGQIGLGMIYAFLIGIVVFFFLFSAMRKMKMIHYSLFKYLEIIFNVMFGMIFFGDQLTAQIVLGGGFIILAGILLRRNVKQEERYEAKKEAEKKVKAEKRFERKEKRLNAQDA